MMDDLISRQAAIDEFKDGTEGYDFAKWCRADIIEVLEQLPSVTPQKVGRWRRKIVDVGYNADWICSECGYKEMTDFPTKFCPNCGAKMEVE